MIGFDQDLITGWGGWPDAQGRLEVVDNSRLREFLGDLTQVGLHGVSVGPGEGKRGDNSPCRTDGTQK